MDDPWSRLDQELDTVGNYKEYSESLYVKLFDNIYSIVLEKESYLFSGKELGYLEALRSLPYPGRYLLVRLSLRKRQKWHTLSSLEKSYGKDIGDKENISSIIDRLCGQPGPECNFIDLIAEEDPDTYGCHSFAEDERAASFSELLHCLPLESLKKIGKDLKIGYSNQKRDILVQKIDSYCSRQKTLSACFETRNQPEGSNWQRLQKLPNNGKESHSKLHFRKQILKEMAGRCVRLRPELLELLDRLNIIFFRSTTYDPSLFLPALLNAFKKRSHASHYYVRTTDIFPSRQMFLDFREALALEAQLLDLSEEDLNSTTNDEGLDIIPANLRKAQREKSILETAYSWWKALGSKNNEVVCNHSFDRFRCEHVLTRIIDISSASLGTLKEYCYLSDILESLLKQRRWGVGRRGDWYNRLALNYMAHMGKDLKMVKKALETVRNGLEDPETRLIYRHQLERRLIRLESKLKISIEHRHKITRRLNSAKDVYISGFRVRDNSFDTSSGRTRWMGKEKIISVEEYALEHYSNLGYKGHHTESRILSTIYGLLFWDIIFSPVPGAFETPYQTAPLDIMDMSFYSTRRDAIEARIADIRNGNARGLVLGVLEKERETRTVCIGVHWTLEQDDILEIIECIEANALAFVCRLISEDYRAVSGGVPDLIVWDIRAKDCKFVEVKSDNDKLSESQKFWIDMLLRAGVPVDLCNVIDRGSKKRKSTKSMALCDVANEV